MSFGHGWSGNLYALGHGRNYPFGMDALASFVETAICTNLTFFYKKIPEHNEHTVPASTFACIKPLPLAHELTTSREHAFGGFNKQ